MSDRPETPRDCHYPWTWMMVASDGGVKPCCYATGELGNLGEASPDAIWNGPTAIELRSFILQDRVHPVCENAPCKFVQNTVRR
jgi:MoaA/NifB/PqqE/SkfB family radical SAM enzyme